MAGNFFSAVSGTSQDLTSGAKTILNYTAPAGGSLVNQVLFTQNGQDATEDQTVLEIYRTVSSNNGTGTAVTPQGMSSRDEAIRGTALRDLSAEPSTPTVLYKVFVHPQAGHGWSPPTPIKLDAGDTIGVRASSAASSKPSALANIVGNE